MKSRKLILAGLILAASVVVLVAADKYIYTAPIDIAGSASITVADTEKPYYFTSVLMHFPEGVNLDNTFSFSYVRGGDTNPVMSVYSATMNSVTWFLPNRIYFKRGDVLLFNNTDVTAAKITFNSEF